MKTKLLLSWFLLGLCIQVVHAEESVDYYRYLTDLKVGQVLNSSLAEAAEVITPMEQEIAYAYPSISYSNPHVVRTNSTGKITFIQLTISPERQLYYTTQLKLLGEPTLTSTETRSQILMAYPEKGESYIIDGYTNKPIMVQYFSPKTPDELKSNEAKHYFVSPSPTPDVSELKPTANNLVTGMWVGVGVIVVLVLGLVWRRKSF